MKFGLSQATIHDLQSVFEQFPQIEEVLIYGSRAKGNHREGSDIDLTLKGSHLTNAIQVQVALRIDDLDTPYLFDISIFHLIEADDLHAHIHRVGKLFYSRQIASKLILK